MSVVLGPIARDCPDCGTRHDPGMPCVRAVTALEQPPISLVERGLRRYKRWRQVDYAIAWAIVATDLVLMAHGKWFAAIAGIVWCFVLVDKRRQLKAAERGLELYLEVVYPPPAIVRKE